MSGWSLGWARRYSPATPCLAAHPIVAAAPVAGAGRPIPADDDRAVLHTTRRPLFPAPQLRRGAARRNRWDYINRGRRNYRAWRSASRRRYRRYCSGGEIADHWRPLPIADLQQTLHSSFQAVTRGHADAVGQRSEES